ncbi:uncharacterized protein At4g38062 isoform X3 [Microcaecilia unicolor]|uniref:Uncharacterized protein At4g38062-like isoform X3 n=1 Tax=Microcaecilia unicolor TaxID=1415580 RepID=A0A6P7XDB9_9AMPH|nr:uncharacterized protein At4g38062-like isoform X3 [Microcaecilia unicolor]
MPVDQEWDILTHQQINSKLADFYVRQQVGIDDKVFLVQIKELQKENRQLQGTIKEKDDAMSNLVEIIQDRNEEYTKAIETEKSNHELTKEQVKECQNIIEEKVQLLNDSTTYYETLMEDLQTQYQEAVDTVKKHSHLEIRQRDDKLVRLKQQIADMFKEKSWEHQQQLDELKNELTRMTEETEVLRTKLKTENLPKQQCPNCRHLTSKLEEKAISLKLKERTIEELQASCRRKIEMKEHQDPSDQKTVQF